MWVKYLSLSLLLLSGCYSDSQILTIDRNCFNALWVWQFPKNTSEMDRLIMSARKSNISLLLINLYSSQSNSLGYNLPEFAYIETIDKKALSANMSLWTVYGTPEWIHSSCDSNLIPLIKGIVAYKQGKPNSTITGIVLDIEPTEPIPADTFISMLQFFQCTKNFLTAHNLQLGIAFRFFWTDSVYFNGTNKPVYQHIIDLVDLPIIMAYRDFAGSQCPDNGIICLSEQAVEYASRTQKPLLIGIETMNCVPYCGDEHVTFYEEGQQVLNQELTNVYKHFSNFHIGFAIHSYQQEYLSGNGKWQFINPKFPCPPMW